METPTRYKCLLCGRDKFTHKTPHKCIGGFRKRGIKWEEIYEEKEVKNKLKTEIMKDEKFKETVGKIVEVLDGVEESDKESFFLVMANKGETPENGTLHLYNLGEKDAMKYSLIQAMMEDEDFLDVVLGASEAMMCVLIENGAVSIRDGGIRKDKAKKIFQKMKNKFA